MHGGSAGKLSAFCIIHLHSRVIECEVSNHNDSSSPSYFNQKPDEIKRVFF
jgi:hypothetical protein